MNKAVNQRIDFLDGLRGWAAVMVMLCHLYPSWLFVPRDYPFFYTLPLRVLVDGEIAVVLFFLLSGFVLSTIFFKSMNYQKLIVTAQFRYLRLSVPIFCSVLLSYLFIRWQWMYTVQTNVGIYMHPLHFLSVLRYSFYDVFFKVSPNHNDYGLQLWTMSVEFIGSYLVFALLGLCGRWKYRYGVYVISMVGLFLLYSHLALFILGVLLADLYRHSVSATLIKYRHWSYHIMALGIFLFLYQTHMNPIFPAIVLFLWILGSQALQRFFSSKVSQFLGRISFALYLTHVTVLCSLARYAYAMLHAAGYNHNLIVVIVSLITIPCVVTLAFGFTWVVEERLLMSLKRVVIRKRINLNSTNIPAEGYLVPMRRFYSE